MCWKTVIKICFDKSNVAQKMRPVCQTLKTRIGTIIAKLKWAIPTPHFDFLNLSVSFSFIISIRFFDVFVFLSKFLHFLFFVFNLNCACNTHTDIRNVPTNKGKIDQTNVYISIREKKLMSTFLFNEKGRKLTFVFSCKATEKFLEITRHPKNYKIWWKLTNVILTLNILL